MILVMTVKVVMVTKLKMFKTALTNQVTIIHHSSPRILEQIPGTSIRYPQPGKTNIKVDNGTWEEERDEGCGLNLRFLDSRWEMGIDEDISFIQ